jgi:hypothetical protein
LWSSIPIKLNIKGWNWKKNLNKQKKKVLLEGEIKKNSIKKDRKKINRVNPGLHAKPET